MCAACLSCCTIAHKQTLAFARFNTTNSRHAQHTVALIQRRGQLVQSPIQWWRKQPAHQLHGVLRKPIHRAFNPIHNHMHWSDTTIHQGFTSHTLLLAAPSRTNSRHAQHTVALTQRRRQLVQSPIQWWRKQPAHQLHGVLRKPIHRAFNPIHNHMHWSDTTIHQGFTLHTLHPTSLH